MNWKNDAIEKLEQYKARCQSLRTIPEEIDRLESLFKSIKIAQMDGISVKGTPSRGEDMLLDNIVQREALESSLQQTQKWVHIVDAGLSVLNSEERRILERFYIQSERGAADLLADELALDVKTVYRRKDAALRRFTIALYGCVEN